MEKYAVVIDFDGTITCDDMGLAVITEFGAPGWEEGGIDVGGRAYPGRHACAFSARPVWTLLLAQDNAFSGMGAVGLGVGGRPLS